MKGVATTDMAMTDMQAIADGLSIGMTGKAFVIGKNGEYITYYDNTH
ncbi:hypothetical protein FACS1894216_14600 [Synergistales bacterium]|nr:hypothetical protein FACS1894216_14600 [Synergistales bacterium]